jgi:hypothetical protein
VQIDELRPLERLVRLKHVDIDAPHVVAARNAAGHVNLLLAAEGRAGRRRRSRACRCRRARGARRGRASPRRAPARQPAVRARRRAPRRASARPPRSAAPPPWRVSVAALALHAGRLDWTDLTTSPAAALALADFSLNAEKIAWPLAAPVVFRGERRARQRRRRGKLTFSGQGDTASATVKLSLAALPLAPLRPYLRSVVVPPLAGELSTDLDLEWRAGGDSPQLKIVATRLALARFTLGDAAAPEAMAESIEASDARIDTGARTASIGRLALRAPRLRVERESERDGQPRWGFERWRAAAVKLIVPAATRAASGVDVAAAASAARPAPAATSASPAPAATAASTGRGDPSWRVAVAEFAIDRGRIAYVDRAAPTAVALDVLDLAVELRGFADRQRDDGAVPRLGARLGAAGPTGKAVGSGVVGSIDARGELAGFNGGVPPSGRAACSSRTCRCTCSIPTSTTSSTSTSRRRRRASRATFAGRAPPRDEPAAARRRDRSTTSAPPMPPPIAPPGRARWRWCARDRAGASSSTGSRSRCAASIWRWHPAKRLASASPRPRSATSSPASSSTRTAGSTCRTSRARRRRGVGGERRVGAGRPAPRVARRERRRRRRRSSRWGRSPSSAGASTTTIASSSRTTTPT